ncbi:MAG: LUD domain-containing protein [Nitrososphaerota archaeon]
MIKKSNNGHGGSIMDEMIKPGVKKFLEKCRDNGFQTSYANNIDSLLSVLSGWAVNWGVKKIVLGGLSMGLAEKIRGELAAKKGYEILEIGEALEGLEGLRTGSMGIFRARAGVEETGGLVVLDDWASNLASLIPAYAVGLIEEDEVLRDYWMLAGLIRQNRPGGLVIISGPSSTSDIELTHVVGVHGPVGAGCIVVGFELD